MNLDGVSLRMDLARVGGRLERGSARGLTLALEHVLAVSNERVPIEYGDLERSGIVSVSADGDEGAVSYSTPYAVPQHEELDYEHNEGRQAKYLESAIYDEQATVRRIIAAELKGEL